jgi:hypothetical protein
MCVCWWVGGWVCVVHHIIDDQQAAERKFEEECGRDVEYYTICNHPIAVHQYKYPAEAQAQHKAYGSRVQQTYTARCREARVEEGWVA